MPRQSSGRGERFEAQFGSIRFRFEAKGTQGDLRIDGVGRSLDQDHLAGGQVVDHDDDEAEDGFPIEKIIDRIHRVGIERLAVHQHAALDDGSTGRLLAALNQARRADIIVSLSGRKTVRGSRRPARRQIGRKARSRFSLIHQIGEFFHGVGLLATAIVSLYLYFFGGGSH